MIHVELLWIIVVCRYCLSDSSVYLQGSAFIAKSDKLVEGFFFIFFIFSTTMK